MSLFGININPLSAIGSALTPAGTHQAQSLQQEQQQVGSNVVGQYGQLLPGAESLAQGNLAFADQLQPYYQAALRNGIVSNTQQGALANAQEAGNLANSNAANAARQTGLSLTAQGAGSGAISGATAGAYGNAENAANSFVNQALSPQATQQRLMQRLALLGGTQSPDLSALSNVASSQESAAFGTPKPQVQSNPMASILGAALPGVGQGVGDWAGSIFGGSS